MSDEAQTFDQGVTAGAGDRRPRGDRSHVAGLEDAPLRDVTIPQMFRETVSLHGALEALVAPLQGVRWTYSQLSGQVDDLAAGLLALGLEKGERIGIWAPNRPEWVVTQFATARIGLILVNINPAYRLVELEYALNKVGCKALVLAPSFKSSDYLEMLQTLAPELADCEPGHLRAARLPDLRAVIRLGEEQTAGMLNYGKVAGLGGAEEKGRLDAITDSLQPGDPINIQFTSGTTGSPKGATLTHFNIVNNGHFVIRALNFTAADRLCIPVPLYHCFGMVMGVLGCVDVGAAMVFPGEAFEPEATLRTVSEERCTGLYGVPTMFVAMLEHPDFATFDLTSLRTGIMAGAPCPIEIMRRTVSDMHMTEVTICYGMTETSPVSFQSNVDDTLEKRVTTVGRVHPHLQVKIVDGEGGTVPIGQQGELCTHGYSVMQGYWNDEERTTESIDPGGWMHTGDLAVMDPEGFCNIVGRVKDMVIRGGENVYPKEVEDFLYTNPKIQEVQVFGVPDARMGEELSAWVVLKSGEEASEAEIREFCQGQIAHFKIPRYVRFKDELPMTVTGKAQKFRMREQMMEELNLSESATA